MVPRTVALPEEARKRTLNAMGSPSENHEPFQTTHWSLVIEAGNVSSAHSDRALEALCQLYWKPLYTFLRRRGYQPQDSQDLVQGLFHHLIQKREFFNRADKNRGQFRSFLLGALKNFLSDQKAKETAIKRGGGEPRIELDVHAIEESLVDTGMEDPTKEFDRRWAMTVLEEALNRLRKKAEARGQLAEHEQVFAYISGKDGSTDLNDLADRLGVTAEAFKMKASRMRKALSLSLHGVVSETVEKRDDVPEELAYLKGLMKKFSSFSVPPVQNSLRKGQRTIRYNDFMPQMQKRNPGRCPRVGMPKLSIRRRSQ